MRRRDAGVTSGWKDTDVLTTSVTSGTSPAAAASANDVEPWQCTTAFSVGRPVSCSTAAISAGWSKRATSSRV